VLLEIFARDAKENSMSTPDQILAHLSRTTDQIFGLDDLRERLASGRPLRIKFGVDCTAPDLHLGHAVNLWMMRYLQDHGHVVVFLLGDTTTRIGDPTGRSTTRPVLTKDEVERSGFGLRTSGQPRCGCVATGSTCFIPAC
jgi:tyrosyl-tRNA synthetase